MKCTIDWCEREQYAIGWCTVHYQRNLKGRDMNTPIEPRRQRGVHVDCSADGCSLLARARGLCSTHWKQRYIYGIQPREIGSWTRQVGECLVDFCSGDAWKAGYCSAHYSQQYLGKELKPVRVRGSVDRDRICVISSCIRNIEYTNGLCKTHDALCYCYKISSIQLEMMWAGGCQICGSRVKLHIDHDHSCCDTRKTGRKDYCGQCVRGCLCSDCNLGLGFLKDEIDRLIGAIAYLEQ